MSDSNPYTTPTSEPDHKPNGAGVNRPGSGSGSRFVFEYPSKQFFRQMLVFGFLVWIVINLISYYNYDVRTIEEADALSWNFYGCALSPGFCWLINMAIVVMYTVGVLGLICFQSWGKIVILLVLVVECFISPFMGLVVYTGSIDMLSIISSVLIGIPWVLSFFEPCGSYFDSSVAEK